MKKIKFFGAYIVPVGETIDLDKPLKIPQIGVELVNFSQISSPIKTGGIDVGKCTIVGKHLTDYNTLLNK